MSLRDQLQAVYDKHGRLTSAIVIDVARDPDHPLHPRFEWDDSIAGEQYRYIQAGKLIRSVKITYTRRTRTSEDVRTLRAWHSLPDPETEASYRPLDEITEDPVATKILLAEMEREWRTFKRRWEHMREFVDLIRREIDAA